MTNAELPSRAAVPSSSSIELPTDYQAFIHASRYARWSDLAKRREKFSESITRYLDFMAEHVDEKHGYRVSALLYSELYDSIFGLHAMGSMRALMTAGPALKRCNVAGFNCSYTPVDSPRAFDEALYILMCGAGLGFSVERQYVNQLPVVSDNFERCGVTIIVGDSKEGWARALRQLVAMLYAGQIPNWDVSKVRPKGAILKTFGGRASGPEPLIELFEFCIRIFQNAAGRRLTSIECHDIMCKIGEIVVVGGVRRSAMISLSNLSDERMRDAKAGEWWVINPHRALANNSWAATEKPEMGIFMQEWLALYKSKSGERGIFNREAAARQVEKIGRRKTGFEWGTNPCSEIILRPQGFCNLSEIIARENDGFGELKEKARIAAILGTFQSTLTDYRYLRAIWKKNAEEERLLGVSQTGIMDCRWLRECTEESLAELKDHVVETNMDFADELGINHSAATTCVKPSGTVSQLVDSASGIHARHSPYYIRRVRGDIKDPLTQFMIDSGIPNEPCANKPGSTVVFSFPVKSPEGGVTRNDMTALEQLEFWLKFQRGWCEHKPSVTISVREHEWMGVGAWVWEHFDEVSGISFLPHSDHSYRQAPYEEVSRAEYEKLLAQMPPRIDWSGLSAYEAADHTAGSQTLACGAGGCEIVDIG